MNRMTLLELVNHISEYDSKIAYKYLDNGEIRTKTYRQLTDDSKSNLHYQNILTKNIHKISKSPEIFLTLWSRKS